MTSTKTPMSSFGRDRLARTYTADGVFVNAGGNKWIRFVTAPNGRTYLNSVNYYVDEGLGQLCLNQYESQKMPAVTMNDEVMQAWKARDGVQYFIISERYTSQSYASTMGSTITLLDACPGYVTSARIVDKNNAVMDIQVPVSKGRDLVDFHFYTANGCEYLQSGGSTYLSEKDIPDIWAAGKAVCTIGLEGDARWYKINPLDAGKTIRVNVPSNGSFAVYQNGTCTQFSWFNGQNTAVLPKDGMIVFAGDPGVRFEMLTE